MSRFNIYAVYLDPRDGVLTDDEGCFIGWDWKMNTYFFQSGHVSNHEIDEPLIWIGTSDSEYTDIDDFLNALSQIVKSPDILDLIDSLELKAEN
jgi:hypothetical protein